MEPWKSLKSWFPSVKSGLRDRTTFKFFTSIPVYVDGEEIDITVNRINSLRKIDPDSVEKLLTALFATGKDKPKNKGRQIRAIAPRCAVYPLY